MKVKSTQWVIADNRGQEREGAYETPAEAAVALERMRLAAMKSQHDAEWRKKIGQAFYTDDWDLEAMKHFAERGWYVTERELSNGVYRLNADISSDETFLREVLWKLRVCGEVQISWTCTGHTRSEMQGAATAAFLKHHGYEVNVWSGGNVYVKAGKAVL